ncbi:hypothetical protein [Bacillus alveayuensis]|uniref:hypothetical protein n=1 Tax=Aeribacillus alveayuensis TaxID=279215 RepID=UPI0005D0F629|nr:hypothetical protein [Bacillus alveayuensis]
MAKKKKPKFKRGDIVVITLYGTVGTITNIHRIDQEYLYEVNHSDILYFENTLIHLSDYEGKVYETEMIEIEYPFRIGDLVQVEGYGQDIFKVVGIHTELWRYKEDSWEEVTYELVRVRDGEWLEASEEELKRLINQKDTEKIVHNIQLLQFIAEQYQFYDDPVEFFSLSEDKSKQNPLLIRKTSFIDSLLDLYNDYKCLYQWFGDHEYKEMMDFVLLQLKKYTE